MDDADKNKTESRENFDEMYARELELQREFEKVEAAYVKTVEEYGEYSDLKSFAEYLRTMEKLFLEGKFRNRGFEQSKDELIRLRIKLLAKNSALNEDVLNSIYGYFKKAGQTIENIYRISKELSEKYRDDPDCQEFILYIQDISIIFLNAEKEHISTEELKERLIRARMDVLSSTGDPALATLEKIYEEFRGLLTNKN